MSTSLLYHGFGIKGYTYVRTEYTRGCICFVIKPKPRKLICPDCASRNVVKKGSRERVFKTVPIGMKPVYLEMKVQIVKCRACGIQKQIKLGFAEPKRSYTRSFERFVLELSKCMTILDISRYLEVSWDVVKDIQKRNLVKKFSKPPLKGLKYIAIDEVAIGKGRKFITVVLDLSSGAVVFVAKGQGGKALKEFWKRLNRHKKSIKAAAIDMSQALKSAVAKNLPDAEIVFDHFHVIQLVNRKLTQLRRELFRNLSDTEKGKVLKGARWLVLKNPENLDETKDERARLEAALALNKPLATAYYLKEELRLLWSQSSREQASEALSEWTRKAWASGVDLMARLADTIAEHFHGILAYFSHRISTGPLEAVNNNIGALQRQAYGFRDKEFFMLKIYALHTMRHAFLG